MSRSEHSFEGHPQEGSPQPLMVLKLTFPIRLDSKASCLHLLLLATTSGMVRGSNSDP